MLEFSSRTEYNAHLLVWNSQNDLDSSKVMQYVQQVCYIFIIFQGKLLFMFITLGK